LGLKSFILFVSLVVSTLCWAQTDIKIKSDSVFYFIGKSQEKKDLPEISIFYAKKAQSIALATTVDSLVVLSNLSLAEAYLKAGFDERFLKLSHKNLKLSDKIQDTLSMAAIGKDIGDYYYERNFTDSAFYYYNKSEKFYEAKGDKFNTAVLLLDIAVIQREEKDFTGSEISSFEGLSLLEKLEDTDEVNRKKTYHYNNLAIIFDQLEQFDLSVKYYKKAINLYITLNDNNEIVLYIFKNNLGAAYRSSKQYDLALTMYESLLSEKDLIKEDIEFYALILDNYAHTLYLSNQHEQLPKLYLDALKAIDTIEPSVYPSIGINRHLAEYYHNYKMKDSAKYYAYKAKEISEQYNKEDVLKSLLFLSRIEEDSIAVKFYDAYIQLNDSIQKNERKVRNKFERVRFETKQIEEENAQITREKMWLMLLSGILLITALLIYIIVTQRNKNKELQLIQQQQEANEEIYNLMLSQQDKIEEARAIDKRRVSQELHDGVLGRLFGTRLSLDSLNTSSTVEAIKARGQYIDELKTIEQDIRKVSHELNTDFISGSGFVDIIKTLVETQTEIYNLNYKLSCDDSIQWDDISNKTKIHTYRIVQETMHNIYKHARASLIQISFELKNNVIWLTISDDGVGFDVDKAKKGIGIKNMNDRINEIDGILHIKSEKEKGTTIIITIPT
jgi:signal transduction histidine kinase